MKRRRYTLQQRVAVAIAATARLKPITSEVKEEIHNRIVKRMHHEAEQAAFLKSLEPRDFKLDVALEIVSDQIIVTIANDTGSYTFILPPKAIRKP